MFTSVFLRTCAWGVGRSALRNASTKPTGKSYSTTSYAHAMRSGGRKYRCRTDPKLAFSSIALGSGIIMGASFINERLSNRALAEEEKPVTLLQSQGLLLLATDCSHVSCDANLCAILF